MPLFSGSESYSSTGLDIKSSLTKLRVLNKKVNPNAASGTAVAINGQFVREEADVDKLQGMSPYKKTEFKIAVELKNVRTAMRKAEEMETGTAKYTKAEIAQVKQHVRKGMQTVQQLMGQAQREAAREKRDEEVKAVMYHVDTTRKEYRRQFVVSSSKDAESDDVSPMSNFTPPPAPGLSSDPNNPNYGSTAAAGEFVGASLHDDQEFQQFFLGVTQRDVEIDKALDRIEAGVVRLHDQAIGLHQEIKMQEVLLDEADTKTTNITMKLQGLNKKLKDTLKKVDNDKMCLYVFCFVVLMAILGVILVQSGAVKSSS